MRGDLGYSIAYNMPVAPLLWGRAKNTLLLSIVALFLTWIISVPLGMSAGDRRGGLLDKLVTAISSFLVSVPELVIAIALLAIVVRLRILHVGGMMSADFEELSAWAKFRDLVLHLTLPVFILVLCETAVIVRHVRASVIEVLRHLMFKQRGDTE